MLKKIIIMIGIVTYSNIFCDSAIHFTIVVPSYNNEQWCINNLNSIFSQDYPNFHVIYINDASRDRTGELVQEYIKKYHLEEKCTYIENKVNRGALSNLYNVIHSCDDKDVIVTVDGDDWLAHSQVLSRLSKEYKDENVWLTFGQHVDSGSNSLGICDYYTFEVIQTNRFRQDAWKASHLRTFYAKLFKLIERNDLFYEGNFFKVTWDLAIMFPMLEMAQERHRFISDVLYVYNTENSLSDFRIYRQEQIDLEVYIRKNMAAYRRISTLFS